MNKFKYKKFYTSQVDEDDCGVAALNMVLKCYGSNYSLAHLRRIAKTELEGTTALGIVKAAKLLDFKTAPIRADAHLLDSPSLSFPFMVHVLKEQKYLHYYTVFAINKSNLVIGDPDSNVGITIMSREDFLKEWSGVAIFFAPQPQYKPKREDKGRLSNFIPLLTHQKGLIFNVTLAAILTTVISVAGTYFLQLIIDEYIPMAMMGTLTVIACGLIVAYIFQSIFSYGQNFLLAVLGQRLTIDVTLGYIRHLYELPMSFFSTRRTGEVVSRFSDAAKIIDALASVVVTIFLDVWIVVSVGIFLCVQNMKLFLISLLAVPIYAVIILAFKAPFDHLNQEVMESNAIVSSSIIENINGIETIKSLTLENKSYDKVDFEFADLLKKSFDYQKTDQLQQSLKSGLKLVLNVIVLAVGAQLVVKNQMTLGQLFTYNALLSFFTEPLESIINLQPKLQMARVANNRLNEVYLVGSEFEVSRSITDSTQLQGEIKMNNISFKYGYGKNTLTDINLVIKPNTKLTIVGMSGSGKTTLAKLLVGLYTVGDSSGQITFNGKKIQDIDLHVLRSYVTYVPQDPVLFSGTILDNLTMGSTGNLTQEEIEEACETAQIKDEILGLPMQFNTEVTEGGSVFSGGQRQRIAIARAILSNAKVLIFDESTSNLDTITEHEIVSRLLEIQNRTVIFVAHRLTIAKRTDSIVVLDHGKLVEQGSHEKLLNKGGYYSALVRE